MINKIIFISDYLSSIFPALLNKIAHFLVRHLNCGIPIIFGLGDLIFSIHFNSQFSIIYNILKTNDSFKITLVATNLRSSPPQK